MRRLLAIKAGADRSEAGARGVVDEKTTREHFEIVREIGAAPGVRRYAARPRGVAGVDLEIAELALPRDAAFEAAHEKLGALRSPLLALPSRIFYDGMQPAVTLVATPRPDGAASLAPWVAECRGGGAAAAGGIGALLHRLAPAFLAAAYLHRLGVSHRALTPAAILSRPDGSLALTDVGFPNGGTAGPYTAPELIHDAAAAKRSPAAADSYSLGVIVAELLSGATPRWNASMGRVEDAATSAPLAPPRAPADGAAADAWALCAALCASPPAARLTLSDALLSPPFAAVGPSDALAPSLGPPRAAVLRAAAAGRMGVPLGAPAASADGDDTPAWLSSAATILEPAAVADALPVSPPPPSPSKPTPSPSPPPPTPWPPPPSKPSRWRRRRRAAAAAWRWRRLPSSSATAAARRSSRLH